MAQTATSLTKPYRRGPGACPSESLVGHSPRRHGSASAHPWCGMAGTAGNSRRRLEALLPRSRPGRQRPLLNALVVVVRDGPPPAPRPPPTAFRSRPAPQRHAGGRSAPRRPSRTSPRAPRPHSGSGPMSPSARTAAFLTCMSSSFSVWMIARGPPFSGPSGAQLARARAAWNRSGPIGAL